MFIKLQFTAATTLNAAWMMLGFAMRDNTITTPTELNALAWSSEVNGNFDVANSLLIRTVEPTTVIAHNYHASTTNLVYHTLQFDTHDDPGTKWYYQFRANTSTPYYYFGVGDSVSSPTNITSNMSVTTAPSSTGSSGSSVTLNNTYQVLQSTGTGSAAGWTYNVRTFWAYVTNDCIIWAVNCTSDVSGWPTTYNSNTYYAGPWIASQYTRYDYHNTPANGILPFVFTNPYRTAGAGYGLSDEHTVVRNCSTVPSSAAAGGTAFQIQNQISTLPNASNAWPMTYFSQVNTTISNRSSLNPLATATTDTASPTSSMYGKGLSSVANDKYPTANLTGAAFSMCPIGWEDSLKGNAGGNITDRSGLYMFNGDYYPGDQLTYNGKTYMLWPGFNGYTDRYAIAVPME